MFQAHESTGLRPQKYRHLLHLSFFFMLPVLAKRGCKFAATTPVSTRMPQVRAVISCQNRN